MTMGRPRLDEELLKPISITLRNSDIEYLRETWDGNISGGVRACVDYFRLQSEIDEIKGSTNE